MNENHIELLEWPGNSPYLSPIENLWSICKRRLCTMDCTSKEKLVQLNAQTRDVEAVIFQTLPLPHLSLPLPLPPTKNEKTTIDNFFFNFCGSLVCFLPHFIILRRQKPSFIAITIPTSLELIVSNYSVFVFLRYQSSC